MTDTLDHDDDQGDPRGAWRQTGGSAPWGDGQENKEDFRRLTREEAQRLRAGIPQVSPWRVVAVQAVAGLVCWAVIGLVTRSSGAAWSALYGAAAVVVPSALLARGMTRGTRSPVAAAAGFMFWEMLKIGVAIAMLVIAASVVPRLNWPALLITMVVCIKVNWVALLWRPRRGRTR
ncbi:MAG: ATP synthase subunit I [Piscinibacter sp.]|nr:ATP synthase subunit I [Piscinibacter sp.]